MRSQISGGSVAASSKKQAPLKRVNKNAKHLKFYSSSCATAPETSFKKMDPSNPDHARRIQQRRRMVSYGKVRFSYAFCSILRYWRNSKNKLSSFHDITQNTLGYDEYLRQVPKAKRHARSMETPTTPDYILDIPNKRWQGQVKAW